MIGRSHSRDKGNEAKRAGEAEQEAGDGEEDAGLRDLPGPSWGSATQQGLAVWREMSPSRPHRQKQPLHRMLRVPYEGPQQVRENPLVTDHHTTWPPSLPGPCPLVHRSLCCPCPPFPFPVPTPTRCAEGCTQEAA